MNMVKIITSFNNSDFVEKDYISCNDIKNRIILLNKSTSQLQLAVYVKLSKNKKINKLISRC